MNHKVKFFQTKSQTILGLLFLLLGGLAIAVPLLATIEISWLIGVLFIASGITQLFHTFQFDLMQSKVDQILLAALSIVTGALVLLNPIASAKSFGTGVDSIRSRNVA